MSESLITARNLSFYYEPEKPILQGLALDLEAGKRVGLVGSNGAGKSTLLHLLVGLLRPTDGVIDAFGKERREEKDFLEVRTRAGLCFQDAEDQLFCPTVFEDVAFGPLNLGRTPDEARAIVDDTLELLGLSGYRDSVTYKLSGGEKRLVSLATVLAMQPEVLLLDEPTAGLDENALERVIDVLTGLPLAMLIVSQDHEFLSQVAGEQLELRDGKIRRNGTG